jgi:hypothetical protein
MRIEALRARGTVNLEVPDCLRRAGRCEQCLGDIDGTERVIDGHILHNQCARFWKVRAL